MKKIIFIEELPTVGKTYLVNEIKKRNLQNVHVVDELINQNIKKEYKIILLSGLMVRKFYGMRI